ncbi:MAG: hypothetical protein M1833_002472 [Piccolia ochrophora]|nr:MAG: hypothetical protein M1833_002472 [Piccolia ochrophora]
MPDDPGRQTIFPLAEVQSALSPYVHTRQEAQRIRRVLSVFSTSHLIHPPSSHHLPSLSIAPCRSVPSTPPPPPHLELSGLRREWHDALRANATASGIYDAELEATRNTLAARVDPVTGPPYASKHLDLFVTLTRQRRKLEGLKIVQHYVDQLSQKAARPSPCSDYPDMLKDIPPPPFPEHNIFEHHGIVPRPSSVPSDTSLISRLQRAVLDSRCGLDKEKKCLNDWRTRELSDERRSKSQTSGRDTARLAALTAVRHELIDWMEKELSSSAIFEAERTERESTMESVDVSAVEHWYNRYLEEREVLVKAVFSLATIPPSVESTQDRPDGLGHRIAATSESRAANRVANTFRRSFLPLVHLQKAVHHHKSHTRTSLSKRQVFLAELLERLSSESHLLAEYPRLAERHRFTKIASRLAGREVGSVVEGQATAAGSSSSRSGRMTDAWAFAADAAHTAVGEHLSGRLSSGESAVLVAQDHLEHLQSLLAANPGTLTKDPCGDDESGGGPWASLHGRLGSIDSI